MSQHQHQVVVIAAAPMTLQPPTVGATQVGHTSAGSWLLSTLSSCDLLCYVEAKPMMESSNLPTIHLPEVSPTRPSGVSSVYICKHWKPTHLTKEGLGRLVRVACRTKDDQSRYLATQCVWYLLLTVIEAVIQSKNLSNQPCLYRGRKNMWLWLPNLPCVTSRRFFFTTFAYLYQTSNCFFISPPTSAWQCVLRDIRSTQTSERNDRGPQEYVEKNPNPNLHCEFQCSWHCHNEVATPSVHRLSVRLCLCSFHSSGPEWPQET